MKITLGGIYFSFGEKKFLFGVFLTEEIRFETKNKSKFVLQFARLFVSLQSICVFREQICKRSHLSPSLWEGPTDKMLNSTTNCDLERENKSKFITIEASAMCVGFNI